MTLQRKSAPPSGSDWPQRPVMADEAPIYASVHGHAQAWIAKPKPVTAATLPTR
ncbi:MAG: hypothetical protein KDJ37_05555 [Hyphomicrobiaceae bacterium]|nr:hypothetical protein [Hyphomicrobiaceae bacterium]